MKNVIIDLTTPAQNVIDSFQIILDATTSGNYELFTTVLDEAFMVLELESAALEGCVGAVKYRSEFSKLE